MRLLKARRGRRWLGRLASLVLLTVATAAVLRLGGAEWVGGQVSAVMERAYALSAHAGFQVREVLVVGRARTTQEEVRQALGAVAGSPILAVDIRAARTRIEALPWVQQAEVERALPDVLVVRLVERKKLAVWDQGRDFAVIDSTGHTIAGLDPRAFADLPVVRGAGAAVAAPAMFTMLGKEPDLAGRVTGLTFVSGRRWNVHLDWRIEIKLPEEGAEAAWARLAQIDRERRLLDGEIAHIDMRFDGRMVLRMSGNETAERS